MGHSVGGLLHIPVSEKNHFSYGKRVRSSTKNLRPDGTQKSSGRGRKASSEMRGMYLRCCLKVLGPSEGSPVQSLSFSSLFVSGSRPFPNGIKKRRGSFYLYLPRALAFAAFTKDKQCNWPTSGMIEILIADCGRPPLPFLPCESNLRSLCSEEKRQVTSYVCHAHPPLATTITRLSNLSTQKSGQLGPVRTVQR